MAHARKRSHALVCRSFSSFFLLRVTPGSQEHDSPYGILGGRAPAVVAVARAGAAACGGRPRRAGGAVGPPELVTEGLFDLVSPRAFPGEVGGFHGLGTAQLRPILRRRRLTRRREMVLVVDSSQA